MTRYLTDASAHAGLTRADATLNCKDFGECVTAPEPKPTTGDFVQVSQVWGVAWNSDIL